MLIIIVTIAILVISVVIHEYFHGWVAYKLGDSTAKDAGRLTLNPVAHIDPFMTIIMPILTFITFGIALGGAKPVPYNPYNLRDRKYGDLKVALGGPGSNFALAVFFGLIARLVPLASNVKIGITNLFFLREYDEIVAQMSGDFFISVFTLSIIFCIYNLLLMFFNLIPIPPLDGSKVIRPFLPANFQLWYYKIEPYGLFIILGLLYFGFFSFILYLIGITFTVIVGI